MKSALILATAAGSVGLTAVTVQTLLITDNSRSKYCSQITDYNTQLPGNSPNNRCAVQEDDLSWGSWFSGKSRSGQFHFIDLLELLHGHERKPLDGISPARRSAL
ncbi:hypothetical protein [Shewanella sp. YIC-542]|uniref:hypothetical protein n=1 Tax=Shewanella mytili TaxID=3377111 RepID=UPI00398EC696